MSSSKLEVVAAELDHYLTITQADNCLANRTFSSLDQDAVWASIVRQMREKLFFRYRDSFFASAHTAVLVQTEKVISEEV